MKEDLIVEREQRAVYERLANTAVKNLNRRYINAQYASSKEEALAMVMARARSTLGLLEFGHVCVACVPPGGTYGSYLGS